jgi:hypothetical protein
MRPILLLCFIYLSSSICFAGPKTDSLIAKLNIELDNKLLYNQKKEKQIKSLKNKFNKISKNNLQAQYKICAQIYEEYKSYQFDSAYLYVKKLQNISAVLKDRPKQYDSKIKLGFILLSSGMFKETFDSIKDVNVNYLTDSARIDYYLMLTRAYYDLASYDNDNYYAPAYNKLAGNYIDSAILISKPDSYDRIYLSGYKRLRTKQYEQASADFLSLLNRKNLTKHQYAIVASTLSQLYGLTKQDDKSVDLLIEAAIADIQSYTKETVALFWLSEKLYKKGDVPNAYNYIQHAMADAEFYGARQRIFQISTVLPIIAAEKLNNSEKQRTIFLIFLISVTFLTFVIIFFSVMLYKQIKKLKAKEKIIEETNAELALINQRLIEGTKIKEEYIGYFFNVISGYILKLEKLKRSVDMKLTVKKYEDISIIVNNINIKKERETLFNTFDHIFLKIFPNFITEFNALLKKEDQIWPKENEVLTTDLRIFALLRMGIEDNTVIGNILEYTEKTIYVYKMRIKAKALIHGDEFEKRIMAIRADTGK